jgi:hypothetical protein
MRRLLLAAALFLAVPPHAITAINHGLASPNPDNAVDNHGPADHRMGEDQR